MNSHSQKTNKRHQENTKLTLHTEETYRAFPVMSKNGPLIKEALERLYSTINLALNEYPRIFAIRIDLRIPVIMGDQYDSRMISRFIDSMKTKIAHDRQKAMKHRPYAHDSSLRYFWTKEYSEDGRPHYHVLLLLNRDAYHTLGQFRHGARNMYTRIQEAWMSALGIPNVGSEMYVHFSENGQYHVNRKDLAAFAELFYRGSYLCKAKSKRYGNHSHSFGSSRH